MKVFSLTEPHTYAFLDLMLEALGIDRSKFALEVHPQEDHVLHSRRYPIFVVADGVTLTVPRNAPYPNPSGAGEVARIFCEIAIRETERMYEHWSESSIMGVIQKANEAVGAYNKAHGRSRETSNFEDFDLFAATASLALIKGDVLHWASICDSYVGYWNNDGERVFLSPGCSHPTKTHHHLPMPSDKHERARMVKKIFRNGLDENGEPMGYGVITGEAGALKYVHTGSCAISPGGLILLFTDGYEHYMNFPEFIELFRSWPKNLESKLKLFTLGKSQEDMMKYGRERSIIAVSL